MATVTQAGRFTEVRGSLRQLRMIQDIFNVSVVPTPEAATFRFELVHAVQPVVEVFLRRGTVPSAEMTPNNLRGVAFFLAVQVRHELRVSNLAPNETYWFRITAADVVQGRKPAVVRGRFRTARRSVAVDPFDLTVWLDGDPSSDGDMWFRFGVYEPGSRLLAGPIRFPPSGEQTIPDGKIIRLVADPLRIADAPEEIAILAEGFDEDSCFPGLSVTGTAMRATDPGEATHGEVCSFAWADCYLRHRLPDTLGSFSETITLHSGRWAIQYDVTLRISGDVILSEQPVVFPAPPPSSSDPASVPPGGLRGLGGRVRRASDFTTVALEEKPVRFTLTPDGSVLQQGVGRYRGRQSWTAWIPLQQQLAGPLTVQAVQGAIHLLGVTARSAVVHATVGIVPNLLDSPVWRELGCGLVGEIMAVPTADGALDLVALDDNRQVWHLRLRAGSYRPETTDWVTLGGPVSEHIAAARDRRGELILVALGPDHDLQWRSGSEHDGPDADAAWQSLGGCSAGPIVAYEDARGDVVVVFVDDERCVHFKRWTGTDWDPQGVRWESLGCLDANADAFSVAID